MLVSFLPSVLAWPRAGGMHSCEHVSMSMCAHMREDGHLLRRAAENGEKARGKRSAAEGFKVR